MDATEVVYEGELGTVHSGTDAAVYLPSEMELPAHKAIPQAMSKTLETPKAAVRIPAEPAAARPHAERAILLAVLKEQLPPFRFRHADAAVESPKTARLPVQVAAGGQTPMICYLVVHGFADERIAALLDVGSETVAETITTMLPQQG